MLVPLIYQVAAVPTNQSIYHGVRKIVRAQTFTHEGPLPPVDLSALGYRGVGDGKLKQLMRNYWNQDHIDAARTKLQVRRNSGHTSVAVSCEGEKKSTKSQGFCLRTVVITQTPKSLEADIIYRSTEVIQKFTADLILLPRIFEALEVAPTTTRFYFSNAFLTALFSPVLFNQADPIHFMEHLKKHDPKYYKTFINAFAKFLETDNRYTYQHRVKQYNLAQKTLDLDTLNDYCRENGASFIHRSQA